MTAAAVKRIKEPGYHADGAGLFLQVTKGKGESLRRSWIVRFHVPGCDKVREMGLGSVDLVELAQARAKAEEARRLAAEGIDPIVHRERERKRAAEEAAKQTTFKEAAEAYITAHEGSWKNAKHRQQWHNTLKKYVYDAFGQRPVHAVDVTLVMKVLDPLWRKHTETASRVRGRIEAVLDWATVRGLRGGENPARWRGHLQKLLPQRSKVQKVRHHPALPYVDLPTFMRELRELSSISARALEFTILNAVRTNETLGAKWAEIALEKKIWTIPPERMKAGREHRVPLSSEAVSILEGLARVFPCEPDDWVFPGAKADEPLSDMALLMVLRGMRGGLTVHGFRSTFRDWAAERTNVPREAAEAALAHAIGDKVEAAYRRGDLFEKRRRLMIAWGRYCGSSGVTPMLPKRRATHAKAKEEAATAMEEATTDTLTTTEESSPMAFRVRG